MLQHTLVDVEQVRSLLEEKELDRRNLRRRDLFWSTAEWERLLTICLSAEHERDQAIQQQIIALSAADPQQRILTQYLYSAIEADIVWRRKLFQELRSTRENWEADNGGPYELTDELVNHEVLVEYHLHQREVRLHQVSLEYLERRRSVDGRLALGQWPKHWGYLQQAWHLQERFCQKVYGDALPFSLKASRLKWCQELLAIQHATQAQRRQRRYFDHQGLRDDAALLQAEIITLTPPVRQSIRWRQALLTGTVLIVIILSWWLLGVSSSLAMSDRSAKQPAALSRSFEAQVPDEPPAQESTVMSDTDTAVRTLRPLEAEQLNDDGLLLMINGDCEKALPLFTAAIDADPTFYEPPNNLAFCLFEQGKVDDAIRQWQRSVELKHDNADGLAGLGMGLYFRGQHEAGLASYRSAVRINPKYADETWLRTKAFWSQFAITASTPLRADQ